MGQCGSVFSPRTTNRLSTRCSGSHLKMPRSCSSPISTQLRFSRRCPRLRYLPMKPIDICMREVAILRTLSSNSAAITN